jgi:hypothetical protein
VLVAKYFVFVGSMLLTLVFVADWFLPNPPIPFPDRSQIETLTIRIASARKWPEKIVFDTSEPTIILQAGRGAAHPRFARRTARSARDRGDTKYVDTVSFNQAEVARSINRQPSSTSQTKGCEAHSIRFSGCG